MQITELDLVNINTYNIPYYLDGYGCLIITQPNFHIWMNKRPGYCDRGRYGFHAEGRNGKVGEIDSADMFPRYFFSMQNAFNEINEFIKFNSK